MWFKLFFKFANSIDIFLCQHNLRITEIINHMFLDLFQIPVRGKKIRKIGNTLPYRLDAMADKFLHRRSYCLFKGIEIRFIKKGTMDYAPLRKLLESQYAKLGK